MAQYNILMNRWNGSSYDSLLPKNTLFGTSAPTTRTVGIKGQFYVTSGGAVYACIAVSGSTYTWRLTSGILPQLEVTTNSTDAATVTVTDGTTTLTGVFSNQKCSFSLPNLGTWTVSATLGGNLVTKTVSVDTVGLFSVELIPVSNVLNDNSWETIRSISDDGLGANYWSVGDAKKIRMKGTVGSVALDNDYWVFILGFNHNANREGNNRIHFQFGRTAQGYTATNGICLVDGSYNNYTSSATAFTMNTSNTNVGGWNNSHMRNAILGGISDPIKASGNTFVACLPSDLRAVMKTRTTYTSAGDMSNTIQSTTDYCWLQAEVEIFGTTIYVATIEANYTTQYQYYASGNSKVRYKHNATTTAAYWWERSPSNAGSGGFCVVTSDGTASGVGPASNSYGLAPCFCVYANL